jgi:glyoxylase-like metal-dependent hydrolase (beta-lactamase superfamily II)
MLVAGFPADAFGTNCYLIATGEGEQCLVVDPGIGILDQLDEHLSKYRLTPAAVLLTHGHLDHTFSVAPVCGARGITAYIHPGDRALLADPAKALSMDLTALFGGRLPYAEPDDVAEMVDGTGLQIAGVSISVAHAPGHTGGSVLFHLDGMDQPHCFSGDVLFAGSIGRTDLPGGDTAVMMASLRHKILPLADDTVVLPGHGPLTTIGRERATNPFLLELDATGGPAGSRRGW